MRMIVGMNAAGRLTLPVDARRQLGIADREANLQLEVSEGKVILQAVVTVPQEDAWAYTPEFRRQLAEALRDVREGRVRQLTEAELEQIADEADRAAGADNLPLPRAGK
jgi:bifunctional DNA-binding transcriptional regulator/antitoxin component of YhaV-PrlF toxin-antitoxin module